MVNRRMQTTSVGRGAAQERTVATELPGQVKSTSETDRSILLFRKAGAPAGSRREVADKVHAVNTVHNVKKVPMYVQHHQMIYNEKDILTGLLETTTISGMLLTTMMETILPAARMIDHNIINTSGDQNCYLVRVYGVDLD